MISQGSVAGQPAKSVIAPQYPDTVVAQRRTPPFLPGNFQKLI